MTTAGKIFKGYAEAIIAQHGFGSNKMVKDWDIPFIMDQKEEVADLINNHPEDSEESKKGMDIFNSIWEGEKFLIDNGYLRKYQPEFWGWRNRRRVKMHGSVYVGLTQKGWGVANLYINAEG